MGLCFYYKRGRSTQNLLRGSVYGQTKFQNIKQVVCITLSLFSCFASDRFNTSYILKYKKIIFWVNCVDQIKMLPHFRLSIYFFLTRIQEGKCKKTWRRHKRRSQVLSFLQSWFYFYYLLFEIIFLISALSLYLSHQASGHSKYFHNHLTPRGI